MIAYFDDTLGSAGDPPRSLIDAEAIAGALELCVSARDCLMLASKTVGELFRSATESGDLDCAEELRQLRMVLWEGRALIEARIIALRHAQGVLLAPRS